jgi:hypothetical protein
VVPAEEALASSQNFRPVERQPAYLQGNKASRQPSLIPGFRPVKSEEEEANMKRALSMVGMLAVMLCTIGLSTKAADKTWTGWISDSHCGAKGMSADHKACAETCVKTKGASWVFVNGKDKKVINISNQDAINGDKDLGHEVKVTGTVGDDGALHVAKIRPVAPAAGL